MVEMMDEQLIKEKMDFYIGTDVVVHIIKKDREWLNGKVLSRTNGVYIIDERKFGIIHVFLKEIFKISEKKRGENDVDSTTTKTTRD